MIDGYIDRNIDRMTDIQTDKKLNRKTVGNNYEFRSKIFLFTFSLSINCPK